MKTITKKSKISACPICPLYVRHFRAKWVGMFWTSGALFPQGGLPLAYPDNSDLRSAEQFTIKRLVKFKYVTRGRCATMWEATGPVKPEKARVCHIGMCHSHVFETLLQSLSLGDHRRAKMIYIYFLVVQLFPHLPGQKNKRRALVWLILFFWTLIWSYHCLLPSSEL